METERRLKVRYIYWLVVRNTHLRQCRFYLEQDRHWIAKTQLSLWCCFTEGLAPWSYRLLTYEITNHSYTIAHGADERYKQGHPYNSENSICQLSNLQICSKVLQIFKVEYKILPAAFKMRRLCTSLILEMEPDNLTGVCQVARDICLDVNVIIMVSICNPLDNLCLHKYSNYKCNISWKSNSLIIFPLMCTQK